MQRPLALFALIGWGTICIVPSPAHSQSVVEEVMETFQLVCLEGMANFDSIPRLAEKRGFSDPMKNDRMFVARVRGKATSIRLNKELKLCGVYSEALTGSDIRLWLISKLDVQSGSIAEREFDGAYKSQRLKFNIGDVPNKGAVVEVTFSKAVVWTLGEETSRVDGTKRIYVWKQALEEARNRTQGERPKIVIQCRAGSPFVWFQFDQVMAGGQTIAYRIDEKPAQNVWAAISTSHTSLGLVGARSVAFAKRLLGAKQLHIRVTPHGAGPAEFSFDLSGFDDAAKPVRQACKW